MSANPDRPFSSPGITPDPHTAYGLVWAAADRTPDAPAIVDPVRGCTLSYREVIDQTGAVAARLVDAGVRYGQLVATLAPNSIEHAIAILAIGEAGAVPALINHRLKITTVAELIRRGDVGHAIVADPDQLDVATREDLAASGCMVASLDELWTSAEPTSRATGASRPADLGEAAFVFYTSGTTGVPKGVVIPHRATVPRTTFMAAQGGLSHGGHNRVAGVLPLNHVMGFYAAFLATLAFNGVYFVISRWDPAAFLDLVDAEHVTNVIASPTHLYDLLETPAFTTTRARSLRTVAHTGAAITPALLDRLVARLDASIWQMYGTTEVMNSLYAGPQRDRPQVMRPGLFSRVRVVRRGGSPDDVVDPGQDGELLAAVDSPAAFSGYLNDPAATAEKVVDGWYRTGDAAVLGEFGEIEIKGRTDDVIISGAENIYPEEVETAVASHPGVQAVAVVGFAHPRWGEVPIACVERRHRELDATQLDQHCRDSSLAQYKRPRHYLFVDTLPRNAMNKILRTKVRDLAAAELEKLPAPQFAPQATSAERKEKNDAQ